MDIEDLNGEEKVLQKEITIRAMVHAPPSEEKGDQTVESIRTKKKRRREKTKPKGLKGQDEAPSSQIDSGFAETGQPDDVTEPPPDQDLRHDQEVEEKEKKAGRKPKKKRKPKQQTTEGSVLSVSVHKADRLKPNAHISHPVVRIHIVDSSTGTYMKKLHANRQVTSYFEKDNASVDYILPILSQPFSIKDRRTLVPVWEETLVFNEDFSYFSTSPDVIVFFEILDFLGMGMAEHKWMGKRTYKGWHHIAWAFLKLRSSTGESNCGKRIRLQLFHFPSRTKIGEPSPGTVEIFHIFSSSPRIPYPATLHVTARCLAIGQLAAHAELMPNRLRSVLPTEEERGHQTFEELDKETKARTTSGAVLSLAVSSRQKKPVIWSRLPGQACRIPNSLMHSLPSGRKGCLAVKFSHDGRSLAAACGDIASFPIKIFEIPSGDLKCQLSGHRSLIYDISWSPDDSELISASSDGTVNVWSVKSVRAIQVLSHPCFVYAAQHHPLGPWLVVTGGYDQVVRVWSTETPGKSGQLLREMDGHRGLINSIIFDSQGIKMFSADSTGAIIMWKTDTNQEEIADVHHWSVLMQIKDPEIFGVAVNQIALHPNGRRLVVYSRDNAVRVYDLRINAVVRRCVGATDFRERLHCAVSPCGTFIMAGSEDGRVYVWNSDSGDQVAVYSDLPFGRPVADVSFHPRDHIAAFCCFGDNQPVVVYKFTPEADARSSQSPPPPAPLLQPQLEGAPSRSLADVVGQRVLAERVSRRLTAALQSRSTRKGITSELTTRTNHDLESTAYTWKDATWQPSFRSVSGACDDEEARRTAVSPHTLPSWGLSARLAATGQMRRQKSSASDLTERNPLLMSWRSRSMSVTSGRLRSPPPSEYYRALYDYKAARADELSFVCGDVLAIVYKESDNWWVAQTNDEKQGYVPTNYIAPCDVSAQVLLEGDENEEVEELQETGGEVGVGIPLFGIPLATSPMAESVSSALPLSRTEELGKTVESVGGAEPKKKKKRKKKQTADSGHS